MYVYISRSRFALNTLKCLEALCQMNACHALAPPHQNPIPPPPPPVSQSSSSEHKDETAVGSENLGDESPATIDKYSLTEFQRILKDFLPLSPKNYPAACEVSLSLSLYLSL